MSHRMRPPIVVSALALVGRQSQQQIVDAIESDAVHVAQRGGASYAIVRAP